MKQGHRLHFGEDNKALCEAEQQGYALLERSNVHKSVIITDLRRNMDHEKAIKEWDLVIEPQSSLFNLQLKDVWRYQGSARFAGKARCSLIL